MLQSQPISTGVIEWCEYCGKPGYTEEHHIKTRGSGGPDITLNKIRLCVEHHRAAQEYRIDRLELVQIVAGREGVTPQEVCMAAGIPVPDQFPPVREIKNEPTLEELVQSYISLEEHERECRWIKGQLLDAMIKSGVKPSWIASQVGVSASQVREMVKVYRAFPKEEMRIPELSWYHHRVAAATPEPEKWIAWAADEQLSTRQMREKILQKEASDEAKSIAQSEEEKEIRQAKKVFAKVEEAMSKGGEGARWLREKLKEIL